MSEVKRIPRRIKKWKKKLYDGHATIKDNIPFKPSWLLLAHKIGNGKSKHNKVTRRWISKIRKRRANPLRRYF
jgi:hypothetical protein